MKKIILIAALLLPSAALASTYTNDFSNMTQPPSGWTEIMEAGTCSFTCNDTDFDPNEVGQLSVSVDRNPALITTYDASATWTDQVIELDVLTRPYWGTFYVVARCDGSFTNYYMAEFNVPSGTVSIYKNGDVVDSDTYELQDADHIIFSVTGSTTTTITLTVNSTQYCSYVDTDTPVESGAFGFGLVAGQEYASLDFYMDNVEVTYTDPAAETPTDTPTMTATPTMTSTPTPYQTPENTFWQEHFITGATPGVQPAEWFDETDDSSYNAQLSYSYTYSMGDVTRTADAATYGEVRSLTRTANVNTYPWIEVEINTMSASATWQMGVRESGGEYYQLQSNTTFTGKKTYNYKTVTNWSGEKTFAVCFAINGSAGSSLTIDSVRIMTYDNTPTCTVTPTISETCTATPTMTDSPTYTATPTDSPTFTYTPTPTDTPTMTATPTVTRTQTPIPNKLVDNFENDASYHTQAWALDGEWENVSYYGWSKAIVRGIAGNNSNILRVKFIKLAADYGNFWIGGLDEPGKHTNFSTDTKLSMHIYCANASQDIIVKFVDVDGDASQDTGVITLPANKWVNFTWDYSGITWGDCDPEHIEKILIYPAPLAVTSGTIYIDNVYTGDGKRLPYKVKTSAGRTTVFSH